jgi:hypothetical protein
VLGVFFRTASTLASLGGGLREPEILGEDCENQVTLHFYYKFDYESMR